MKKIGYIDGRRTYFYDDTVISVSKDGSDAKGNGSPTAPYLTIGHAFTKVTAARKAVLLSPGVYQENLTWPSINGVQLIGLEKPSNENYGCIVKTEGEGAGEGPAITVNPSEAYSKEQVATFEMTIQNILLDHADAKGITLDNQYVGVGDPGADPVVPGRKFNCYLSHVVGEGDGRFLEVVHTAAGECMRVYMDGDSYEIEGLIYFAVKNDGDRLYCSNVWLGGGVETSVDAIAGNLRFKECILKLNGGAGGEGTAQLVAIIGCVSETDGTYAAAAGTEVPDCVTLTDLKLT